ncbi:MAG TPA: hypothetical protein VF482_07555 [Trebonia sp.]
MLAARLWLQAGQAYQDGRAWWQSERRIRAALPANVGTAHLPDAEIHWPSIDASPHAGQVWAVEVELTPKPATRTARIMGGLLSPPRYHQVVYLAAPAARPVVARAAAGFLTLIDELPYAPGMLAHAPARIRETVAAAFDIQCVYRPDHKQATVVLTITDATPGIITALLTDPRTDSDTAAGTTPATFADIPDGAIATETAIKSPRCRRIPDIPGSRPSGFSICSGSTPL